MYLRKPQNLKPQPKVYSLHFSSLCMVASDIMSEAQQAWIVFGFTVARKHQLLAPRSNIATIILRHWRLPSRSEARWKKQQPESCSNLCFFFGSKQKGVAMRGRRVRWQPHDFPMPTCVCASMDECQFEFMDSSCGDGRKWGNAIYQQHLRSGLPDVIFCLIVWERWQLGHVWPSRSYCKHEHRLH